jgi:hypothetical protein
MKKTLCFLKYGEHHYVRAIGSLLMYMSKLARAYLLVASTYTWY